MVPSLLAAVGFFTVVPSLLRQWLWACGSGVVNYSGPAAVGYELQWACTVVVGL